MRNLFLFVLLLLVQFSFSQDLQVLWQGCYGGSEPDFANDILEVEDGYLILGNARSNDGDISSLHGGQDGWLIKTDFYGNLIWEKTFGGINADEFVSIVKSADNNFFILSSTYSSDGDISYDPYPGSTDFWIVKIDGSGNIIWDKIVGGNMLDQIWTGVATSDGGVVALGWTGSNDGDISNWYGLYDTWMVKLNSEGEIVADMSFGTSGFDFGQALIETSDGGFLVGGSSIIQSGGNINCEPFNENAEAIVFKLSPNLDIEWQMCYGGSEHDGVAAFLELDDGYLVGAYGGSDDGDLTGSNWHGNNDIWIIRTDFYGNILWQKCYGGSLDEWTMSLFRTADGGLMFCGNTESHDGDVVGNHTQSEYSNDIWLVKLSGEGELLWQQCIGGLGNEESWFGAIKKSDTDFVIAGQFNKGPSFDVGCTPFGVFADMPDVWIFEVKDTTTFVTDNKMYPANNIKVYPNPAREYVVFELSQAALNNNTPNKNQAANGGHISQGIPHATAKNQAQGFGMTSPDKMVVTIVNVYGQEVAEMPLHSGKTVWDTREVQNGIYFYRLDPACAQEGKVLSGKIVVQ